MSLEEAVRLAQARIRARHSHLSQQRQNQILAAFVYATCKIIGGSAMFDTTRGMLFRRDKKVQASAGEFEENAAWALVEDPEGWILGPLRLEHYELFRKLQDGSEVAALWDADGEDPADLAGYSQFHPATSQ